MKHWHSHDGSVALWHGDCRDELLSLDDNSVDACITDPPYGLGFCGEKWDHAVPGADYWYEVYRVLEPGAPLLAFGGCRTFHRLACAIEDAGFEIRDCLCWLYGQGFPKSKNISKAIDAKLRAKRKVACPGPYANRGRTDSVVYRRAPQSEKEVVTQPGIPEAEPWDGWGTQLRPGWEPILMAMKPLDGSFANNALKHGVAGLNIDGCRLPITPDWQNSVKRSNSPNSGRNKPSISPIGTFIRSNPSPPMDASKGRWPPNAILDPEVAEELDRTVGERPSAYLGNPIKAAEHAKYPKKRVHCYGYWGTGPAGSQAYSDTGGPSRYFYCPKITTAERTAQGEVENRHKTVKPLALMRWLVRLTATPTGGTVLDPFMGSGSTMLACIAEGRPCIGIEIEEDSFRVAVERVRNFAVLPDDDSADDKPKANLKGQLYLCPHGMISDDETEAEEVKLC